ncbi:PA2169 family four-helix-bundle protein [Histidinibacterium lentulum]|uniref:PA2169 family four-helix-bundle protein n=1 Tax=Histidinibacterium lentulum TaxID=2480588 RepID=A0A3N2RA16_9RHOB|nr:PA2169 family four-helix-bundle protein [Histidinibacterium lentulum]ROU04320.1 PA2169 family four-helix-bundle protein [Histidinibacterium lentulum]
MSQRLNHLNDIIATLKTGANFYRKAARQLKKPDLEAIFVENADLRDGFAVQLAAMVEEVGGEVKEVDATEKTYELANRVGAMIGDTEKTLIDALEEHEERTLELFRRVIHQPDSARDQQMLQDMMEHLQQSHGRMRELRRAT